jgi:c-di-GMP-related signal transduction protein
MDVYVARQAIFNVNREVIAYELLFRNNNTINEFISVENSNPTLDVIRNSFSVIGLDKVTEGKRAFINFDEELIKSDIIEFFPNDSITIEILENVKPDKDIIECCRKLKEKGYIIALDDFQYAEQFDELFRYIDIIKVDFFITKGNERKKIIEQIKNKNKNIKFLAEKVETEEEYIQAAEYGYCYFQGYFFCKPKIISGKDISGYKFNYMRLIKELDGENIDIIEDLIKKDVSLSYKLLKAANSVHYSLKRKIISISDAIMIIGINELKKWVFIITLQNLHENTEDELLRISLIRASFGELLSRKIKKNISSFDMFLTGMFSLIDALMNIQIDEILIELPISSKVKEALLDKKNIFYELLNLIMEYEKGNWDIVNDLSISLGLNEEVISACYLEAIESLKDLGNM